MYLKLQSSCLLFSNESSECDRGSLDTTAAIGTGLGHKKEPDEDSDEDEIWNGMETVGGQRKRPKSELAKSMYVGNLIKT